MAWLGMAWHGMPCFSLAWQTWRRAASNGQLPHNKLLNVQPDVKKQVISVLMWDMWVDTKAWLSVMCVFMWGGLVDTKPRNVSSLWLSRSRTVSNSSFAINRQLFRLQGYDEAKSRKSKAKFGNLLVWVSPSCGSPDKYLRRLWHAHAQNPSVKKSYNIRGKIFQRTWEESQEE